MLSVNNLLMINAFRRQSTGVKWILCILLFCLVIVLVTARIVSYKVKPFVKKELAVVLNKATSGLYSIDFDRISTNFITGNVYLTNVEITPSLSVYNKLVRLEEAPNNLYKVKLAKLSVYNIHPLNIFFKKTLDIDLILFDKPEITMLNKTLAYNACKPPVPEKSPYDFIKQFLKHLRVKKIDFKDARFSYVNNNPKKPITDSISRVSITLKDWLISEHSAKDKSRYYLLKDVYIYANNYTYATPDSMYYIKADKFEFSASQKRMNINAFAIEPRYAEQEFAKVKGYAVDRYAMQLSDIQLDGILLSSFIKNRQIFADEVNIANGNLAVFNDNRYPRLGKDKSGRFPQQLLQRLRMPITLKKVIVNKMDISYGEVDRKSGQKGHISFNKTYGVITNVSNEATAKNAFMEADVQTLLMGQGKVTAGFKFDLLSPKGSFAVNGQLLNMDGRQLNKITKPLALLQIKSCLVRRLAFNIKADEDVAKGKVEFVYNDLSLGIMKMHEGGQRLKRLGILSLITNAMIIETDNPTARGKFVVAPINYKRKPTATFFNYLWQSLFQGVKYSIGFTPQKEAEIKSYVKKFEDIKSEREKRRLRRELRRLSETKNVIN